MFRIFIDNQYIEDLGIVGCQPDTLLKHEMWYSIVTVIPKYLLTS